MLYVVEIDLQNNAFGSRIAAGSEIARVLRELANDIEDTAAHVSTVILRDSNGNRVGKAAIR